MQVLLNTPAEKLIFGKDGKVAGVVAKDKDGNTLNIHAKAVIIATGGFADNPEMMKKYTRFPNTDGIAQTGKNGVGIQMACLPAAAKRAWKFSNPIARVPVLFPQLTMFPLPPNSRIFG